MSNESIKGGPSHASKKSSMIIGSIIAVLFIAIMVLVLNEGTKKTIALTVDGEEMQVRTHAKTVEQLLAEQNIEVAQHDAVTPALDTLLQNGSEVEWLEAKEVTVAINNEPKTLWTTSKQVSDVLEEAGVEVTEHDIVIPDLDETLTHDHVSVTKAFEVAIVDAGEKQSIWTVPTTVERLLKNVNIELREHDELQNVELEDFVSPERAAVEIVRIDRTEETVEAPSDFKVEEKQDAQLEKGKTKVLQEGKKGKVRRTYEIVVRNGEEVERNIVSEEVVDEPTNKVVAIGAKQPAPTPAKSTNNVSVSRDNSAAPSGGREFYVEATAYTPYCTGCSGISAAGINLRANPNLKLIAVDPRVIPMGSKVWVEGYGYAVAGDTGGAIKGNRIDVLMQTKQQAYSWGRKKVKIKVMN